MTKNNVSAKDTNFLDSLRKNSLSHKRLNESRNWAILSSAATIVLWYFIEDYRWRSVSVLVASLTIIEYSTLSQRFGVSTVAKNVPFDPAGSKHTATSKVQNVEKVSSAQGWGKRNTFDALHWSTNHGESGHNGLATRTASVPSDAASPKGVFPSFTARSPFQMGSAERPIFAADVVGNYSGNNYIEGGSSSRDGSLSKRKITLQGSPLFCGEQGSVADTDRCNFDLRAFPDGQRNAPTDSVLGEGPIRATDRPRQRGGIPLESSMLVGSGSSRDRDQPGAGGSLRQQDLFSPPTYTAGESQQQQQQQQQSSQYRSPDGAGPSTGLHYGQAAIPSSGDKRGEGVYGGGRDSHNITLYSRLQNMSTMHPSSFQAYQSSPATEYSHHSGFSSPAGTPLAPALPPAIVDQSYARSLSEALGMEKGFPDVADEWVESLRELLGKHLYEQLKMFEATVRQILMQMSTKSPAMSDADLLAATALLEFRESRVVLDNQSTVTLSQLLDYCRQIGVTEEPLLQFEVCTNLLRMPLEVGCDLIGREIDPGNSRSNVPMDIPTNALRAMFNRMQGLSSGSQGMRIRTNWKRPGYMGAGSPSSPVLPAAQSGPLTSVSDEDIVVALFLHMCDLREIRGQQILNTAPAQAQSSRLSSMGGSFFGKSSFSTTTTTPIGGGSFSSMLAGPQQNQQRAVMFPKLLPPSERFSSRHYCCAAVEVERSIAVAQQQVSGVHGQPQSAVIQAPTVVVMLYKATPSVYAANDLINSMEQFSSPSLIKGRGGAGRGVVGAASPHFNVYRSFNQKEVAQFMPTTRYHHYHHASQTVFTGETLTVDEGRCNCFESILVFLLSVYITAESATHDSEDEQEESEESEETKDETGGRESKDDGQGREHRRSRNATHSGRGLSSIGGKSRLDGTINPYLHSSSSSFGIARQLLVDILRTKDVKGCLHDTYGVRL